MTKININSPTKVSQADASQKKARYGVLISDKVEFKARCIFSSKKTQSTKMMWNKKGLEQNHNCSERIYHNPEPNSVEEREGLNIKLNKLHV